MFPLQCKCILEEVKNLIKIFLLIKHLCIFCKKKGFFYTHEWSLSFLSIELAVLTRLPWQKEKNTLLFTR